MQEWTIDRVDEFSAWNDRERRRYQWLWGFEAVCFPLSVSLWFLAQAYRGTGWFDSLCLLFAISTVPQLPVVICLLSQLIGRPIVLDLGLWSSHANRALTAELVSRASLSDAEFRELLPPIPATLTSVVDGVRAVLRQIDPLCDRLLPNEPLGCLLEEVDYSDIYFLLAKRFRIESIAIGSSGRRDGSIAMILNDVMLALAGAGRS
jgi:hypothetical protein